MEQNVLETSLELVRQINAPIAAVYETWVNPHKMQQWMGPGETQCEGVDIDLRIGGKYRIHMVSSDCEHPIAVGEYREIVPQSKLVFTWSWEGSDMPETLVSVTFEPDGDGTRLTLLHEKFPDRSVTDKHHEGWTGCLANLVTYCES